MRIRVVGYAQRSRGSRLLHTRRDVDRHSSDRARAFHAAAQQHVTGVDADAHVESGLPERSVDFHAKRSSKLKQSEAAAHRALRVVLLRFVGAEHRQYIVAKVLQYLAAMFLHACRRTREHAVHQCMDLLGIKSLGERGRSHAIEEEDRDLLESLPGNPRFCVEHSKPGAHCGSGRVDDRTAQNLSLCLKCSNAGLKLLSLRGH